MLLLLIITVTASAMVSCVRSINNTDRSRWLLRWCINDNE